MATSRPLPPFVLHCLELLAGPGGSTPVRSRAMFGGFGLYVEDLFVALIADERLYLKADARTAPCFAAAGSSPFTYHGKGEPVTMGYWLAPDEAMDSAAEMAPWLRLAVQAAIAARAGSPAGRIRRAAPAAAAPHAAAPAGRARRR